MNFKTYTSEDNLFSLTLPIDWEGYDSEDTSTYAFFNAQQWTGNLRISPFYKTSEISPDQDSAKKYLDEFLDENPQAKLIKLGNYEAAYYMEEYTDEDNDTNTIYYWSLGSKNSLFMCSFTIAPLETNQVLKELKTIESILSSIKSHYLL